LPDCGDFWRGTAIEIDTRLRVARALAKTEAEAASQMMAKLKVRFCPEQPPSVATDGKGAYREALVATWGQVPAYSGKGRPPELPQPDADWPYVQVVKQRDGHRLVGVSVKVVYGDPKTTLASVGGHTAYVERTNLTSRQMNARLVRKTLSFSKQVAAREDASAWEDAVYNLARLVKTLRQETDQNGGRWQQRSPAMAAGLTDHIWTIKELMMTVVVPVVNSR
jgi:hypothetical protein